ncbi:hypothetical protein GGI16_005768 [Coemansia sp. S142-1]|nr:hypothetical protein GGI16_005768 [Coemansia sp. S142-1]KAJ2431005.1 hypothetical protein GGF41_000743 [Coemansia sp. RSA 2531]
MSSQNIPTYREKRFKSTDDRLALIDVCQYINSIAPVKPEAINEPDWARLISGNPGSYNMGGYYIHVSPAFGLTRKRFVIVETSASPNPSHNVGAQAEARANEDEGFEMEEGGGLGVDYFETNVNLNLYQ